MVRKKQKAFSIIELLLIIAILALVLSIILVNAGTYKDRAQKSVTLTEVNAALTAIESCGLDRQVMFCNGTEGVRESSVNCKGDDSLDSKPIRGTALCGTVSPINWSELNVWPNIQRNGYSYASFAGSQTVNGTYGFTIFRDKDQDGVPDSSEGLCCTHKGCREIPEPQSAFGSNCYALAGIRNED